MVKVVKKYRLGGVCVQLVIISRHNNSANQLEKSLAVLFPFQTDECDEDMLNLRIADFESNSHEYKGDDIPFISFVLKDNAAMSWHSNGKHKEFPKKFYVASRDPLILNPTRILLFVVLLISKWHTLHNGLSLHAAAVSRNNNGFLFLGRSGAGKSTVSFLSAELDIPVLAEDRVFLFNQNNDYFLAAGPHYPTEFADHVNLHPPLRGVFILVKDNEDYLKPLSQSDAAKHLFAAFTESISSRFLSTSLTAAGFRTTAKVARKIPTFELHFRKSSNFWKLINERFPG